MDIVKMVVLKMFFNVYPFHLILGLVLIVDKSEKIDFKKLKYTLLHCNDHESS